ncbi:hypothetical protein JET18_10830 [Chryseobacterium sp. L7]|uniref:YD repeat-containing protein n=1 Tax=Chryseobacterium endalhagicum TaxID=2797638 RepID=A0ABS1QGD1_9FLAO|nr:hypothetical protein [Chryseobacterium endalhagicum]MBL1221337.1 hypothetical protein [Chryseobacterium endalhagicum]
MKTKLLFFATLLAFTSCSNNDDEVSTEISQPVSQAPNKISCTFPLMAQSSPGKDPNYYFEYDGQGKVIKKIGGIMTFPSSTGGGSVFSNSIYTTVSYNGNTAIIGTYSSDFNVKLNKRSFEFDSQGRVVKSVIDSPYPEWEKHLTYTYDNAGKLVEISTQLPNMPYVPTDPNDYILTYIDRFTYDTSGNLQKVVATERRNNVDFLVLQETEFSNFDTAQNPFKRLALFDEYFYLSLSKNNPQKKITRYSQPGGGFSYNTQEWTNQYEPNGNLKLFY